MFQVIVNDGTNTFPEDDIYYIVCKEGVYLKKRLGVMESIAPVKNISILNSIETMAKMHISKIPATKAQQVINFFKAVYKEYSAEAIVLLFYNQETLHHEIIVPVQEVSGGAAEYDKGITLEGYNMIGTIHSHAAMSAFHSGVDDDDEKTFDGLHITFGNMSDEDISVSASIVANGYRVMVNPSEYINKMILTVNIDEDEKIPMAQRWSWDLKTSKMVKVETNKFYTKRKFDQRYRIELSTDPEFPYKWMDYVSKKTYSHMYGNTFNLFDNNYEGNYWDGWYGHYNNKLNSKHTPQSCKKHTNNIREILTPDCKVNMKIEQMDDSLKKSILAWAIEKLEGKKYDFIQEKEPEKSDEPELTHYQCLSCQEYLSVNEEIEDAQVCCPVCETDEYLIEVTAREVMMAAEGVEFIDVDDDDDSEMIKCNSCGSIFDIQFLNEGMCPACANPINPTTSSMEDHMNNDSGMYLDSDSEEVNKSTIDEIEHIPVPGAESTPLNKINKPGTFASIFHKAKEDNKGA